MIDCACGATAMISEDVIVLEGDFGRCLLCQLGIEDGIADSALYVLVHCM